MTRSCDAVRDIKSSGSCEVDRDTGSDKSLSVLLEEEYFLLKVLSYVVEDGLHECRLVCRRWRDACGKLPVQLRMKGIPSAKLSKAADLFPETKTLNLCEWTLSADVIERHVVTHLPRLKNLKHFSLFLYGESIDLRNLVACFSLMQHLRLLRLLIQHEDTLHCLIHDLSHLQNLTSLSLSHNFVLQNDLDPNSCVQGLSRLGTAIELLINRRGELVFPTLTGLTSLIVYGGDTGEPPRFSRNLQVRQSLDLFV